MVKIIHEKDYFNSDGSESYFDLSFSHIVLKHFEM